MSKRPSLPTLALLAGGLATRLHPITQQIPKSMVEVAGRPFIAHQLELCVRKGVRKVVVCSGYLAEQIEAYVGNGSQFAVKVEYSIDWPLLLGTGGALKKALPLLGSEFFVMYGDSYLDIDFAPVYNAFVRSHKAALMTVYPNKNRWDTSNVEFFDGEIRNHDKVNRTAKMQYIDYGLGLFRSEAFADWPDDSPFDLAHVYAALVKHANVAGYEVSKRFYEIGTPAGLKETSEILKTLSSAKHS